MTESAEEAFKTIVDGVAKRLQPIGFKRRALSLERAEPGTKLIVNFQKSTKSNSDKIVFTVNIGIVVEALLEEISLKSASIWDAHYRERIGMFLSDRRDAWWEITSNSDSFALTAEIEHILISAVLPRMAHYTDVAELEGLWRTGASPGLTDFQRIQNLQILQTRR